MEEGDLAEVVDGCEKLQRRVQRGKPVARADGERIAVGSLLWGGSSFREIAGPGGGIVDRLIARDVEDGTEGGAIGLIADGDEGVEAVIAAAEEDENQFAAIASEAGLGEGTTHPQRDIGQRGECGERSEFEEATAIEATRARKEIHGRQA